MSTGENEQGLRKVLDMTRLISIILLLLHFYYQCYGAFKWVGFAVALTDRLLINIQRTGLFNHFHTAKWLALSFLVISLTGAQGKKTENLHYSTAFKYIFWGMFLYFGSYFLLLLPTNLALKAGLYIGATGYWFSSIIDRGYITIPYYQGKV